MLKKLFGKKTQGISQYVSAVISIWAILLFFVTMVYLYGEIVRVEEIERINRKYLLSMEREGYLTSAYEAELVNELTA